MPSLVTEIVRRSDRAKGFVVLPKRWIVERTIGWLGRCRRLAKDWENLNHNALAFIRLASIRLMLRGCLETPARVLNLGKSVESKRSPIAGAFDVDCRDPGRA
jgi:AMMECR1 domain-containing protein